MSKISLQDAIRAQNIVLGKITKTVCKKSEKISDIASTNIYIKFENQQYTGSFKERGALNFLHNLSNQEKKKGVVAMSAGNHAQGVAYHARKMNIPVTIVMPIHTPYVKVRNTKALGANVELIGETLEESYKHTKKLEKEKNYVYVPPFDDARIIAGQSTVVLEMLEQQPEIDTLLIPIGGGGLMAGMASIAKKIKPNIQIIGVQTELYPGMKNKLENINLKVGGATIAEGIAVKNVGEITSEIIKKSANEIIIVKERQIETAICMLLEHEKSLAEGAGAISLAAVLSNKEKFKGKNVGIILSGGNIDQRVLASILMRNLVELGRLGRMHIFLPDQPKALAKVSKIIGEQGGNIVEMTYQHIFTHAKAKETSIEIAIETQDKKQLETISKELNKKGYHTELINDQE